MTSKELTNSSSDEDIDNFLQELREQPQANNNSARGRLIFALDATASRQATWDQATQLQYDMFSSTLGIGELDLQLVYYRGFNECRSTRWIKSADTLAASMAKIRCQAGHTQIERILRHGLTETRSQAVNAMVFVGDCMEEKIDTLGDLAGQLKLVGLPVFVFQEGFDPIASRAFADIAALSGGAHCRFDQSSARQLGQLLRAVAVYAAGGRRALEQLGKNSSQAATLLKQLS